MIEFQPNPTHPIGAANGQPIEPAPNVVHRGQDTARAGSSPRWGARCGARWLDRSRQRRQRRADVPDLAVAILVVKSVHCAPHHRQTRLGKEVGESVSVNPHIARGRLRGERRNVTSYQVRLFQTDHIRQACVVLDFHPKKVEQPVAVERVSEHVGMVALAQELSIRARRSHEDAHGIRRETCQSTVWSEQLVAPAQENRVCRAKPSNDGVAVVTHVYRHTVESGKIEARVDFVPRPDQPHHIRSGIRPLGRRVWRELTLRRAEAAQIDAGVRRRDAATLGKQAVPQHRVVSQVVCPIAC